MKEHLAMMGLPSQGFPEGYVTKRLNAFVKHYFKEEVNKIKNNELKIKPDYQFIYTSLASPGYTVGPDDMDFEEGVVKIYISPFVLIEDNKAKLAYLTVGHELVHAIDFDNGNYLDWYFAYGSKETALYIMEHHAYTWNVEAEKRVNEYYGGVENLKYFARKLPADFSYSYYK